MKVFISQPMNGYTDTDIAAARHKAIETLKKVYKTDIEVLDTVYTDFSADAHPLEYLGRSISDLAKADLVYFAKGWENSRGCIIENICAIRYGLHVLEYQVLEIIESCINKREGEQHGN